MVATWRVFGEKIALQPDKAEKLVLATCALHNFLRVHDQINGVTVDTETVHGNWRTHENNAIGDLEGIPRRPPTIAKEVRNAYCDYVNHEGAVPWQEAML